MNRILPDDRIKYAAIIRQAKLEMIEEFINYIFDKKMETAEELEHILTLEKIDHAKQELSPR